MVSIAEDQACEGGGRWKRVELTWFFGAKAWLLRGAYGTAAATGSRKRKNGTRRKKRVALWWFGVSERTRSSKAMTAARRAKALRPRIFEGQSIG
jgi:hypothetical protein